MVSYPLILIDDKSSYSNQSCTLLSLFLHTFSFHTFRTPSTLLLLCICQIYILFYSSVCKPLLVVPESSASPIWPCDTFSIVVQVRIRHRQELLYCLPSFSFKASFVHCDLQSWAAHSTATGLFWDGESLLNIWKKNGKMEMIVRALCSQRNCFFICYLTKWKHFLSQVKWGWIGMLWHSLWRQTSHKILPHIYLQSYDTHRQHFMVDGNERKDRAFAACAGAHNEYILELKSTNKLIDQYHSQALPWVLEVSCLFISPSIPNVMQPGMFKRHFVRFHIAILLSNFELEIRPMHKSMNWSPIKDTRILAHLLSHGW